MLICHTSLIHGISHTYTHTYIHAYTYIHTHTRIYIHTYIHVHTHTCILIHTYTYTHIYIHTYTVDSVLKQLAPLLLSNNQNKRDIPKNEFQEWVTSHMIITWLLDSIHFRACRWVQWQPPQCLTHQYKCWQSHLIWVCY